MHFPTVSSILLTSLGVASAATVPGRSGLERRLGPSGINNRGSSQCSGDNVDELAGYINTVPDTQLYDNGFHIACSSHKGKAGQGGHCAFLQGTSGSINGRQVKALIQMLSDKSDVSSCGSVPVSLLPEFGSVNQLSKMGMLTVNYVLDTDNLCPPGVCGATAPTVDPSTCPDPNAQSKRSTRRVSEADMRKLLDFRAVNERSLDSENVHSYQKRDLTPSSVIELANTLTTAGGVQLVVDAITPTQPTAPMCPLTGAFFTQLVPELAGNLQLDRAVEGWISRAQIGSYTLMGVLDTTPSDHVVGALIPADLDIIIGSMAHLLARDKLQAVQVKFKTAAGAAALSVALAVFIGQ